MHEETAGAGYAMSAGTLRHKTSGEEVGIALLKPPATGKGDDGLKGAIVWLDPDGSDDLMRSSGAPIAEVGAALADGWAVVGIDVQSRQFARVLQLLGEHPLTRVSQAIEACRHEHLCSAEAVIQRTRSLAAIEAATRGGVPTSSEATPAPQVHVPLPDLSRFNQLLGGPAAESPVSVFFA